MKESEEPCGFGRLAGQALGRRGCVTHRRMTAGWEGTWAVDPSWLLTYGMFLAPSPQPAAGSPWLEETRVRTGDDWDL